MEIVKPSKSLSHSVTTSFPLTVLIDGSTVHHVPTLISRLRICRRRQGLVVGDVLEGSSSDNLRLDDLNAFPHPSFPKRCFLQATVEGKQIVWIADFEGAAFSNSVRSGVAG